jgi:endonuclease YncB( thermonuclease family)
VEGVQVIAQLALAAALAVSNPVPARGPVIMVDGDTIRIDGVTIRLLDIDTPETYRPRCEAELVAGLAAKQRLRALLDGGAVAYVPNGKLDRYGRTLAHVLVNGADVGAVLLAEGYALHWEPGPEAKAERLRHWCHD